MDKICTCNSQPCICKDSTEISQLRAALDAATIRHGIEIGNLRIDKKELLTHIYKLEQQVKKDLEDSEGREAYEADLSGKLETVEQRIATLTTDRDRLRVIIRKMHHAIPISSVYPQSGYYWLSEPEWRTALGEQAEERKK